MFSQGGKTSKAFNVIGQRLDDDPAPVLYIGPTRNNIINVIEPKIDDMLRNCPSLWAKTIKGKAYTKTKKLVGGVSLRLAWAGSATELAADSACIVLVDEIDRMERNIKGEGNVIELADARHNTYPDGKTIGFSTPTEGNVDTYIHSESGVEHWKLADPEQLPSAIWVLWQEGTRHEWSWPCPECSEYFIPRFKLLTWPEGGTPAQARTKARLACPHCGSAIASRHKDWMNARGVYVAPGQRPLPYRKTDKGAHLADYTGKRKLQRRRNGNGVTHVEFGDFCLPDDATSDDATFWVSGLANFSSKKTFGDLASRFLKAARSGEPEKVQGVLNTQLGECFKFGGDAPEWEAVAARKADYSMGDVPAGVRVLVAFVDVQKDRLPYVVRGFGKDLESWAIDVGELWGDTSRDEVWEDLESVLFAEYGGLSIRRMAIDSGYRSDQVYAFCRKWKSRCIPTKGHDQLDKPYYASKVDVDRKGKVKKTSIQLWHFDTDRMKSWVHSRVEAEDGKPGAWHLPGDIPDDYCRQIVGEQRIVKPSGRVTWKKVGRNDFLDCEAGCYLVARMLRAVIGRTRPVTTKKTAEKETQDDDETEPNQQPPPPIRRRRSGGWATNWR